jgi:hypothetical protein
MAVRVVKGRHFDQYLNEEGQLEVAICIGNARIYWLPLPHRLSWALTNSPSPRHATL